MKNKNYWKIRWYEYCNCLKQIYMKNNNVEYLEKFLNKYDDLLSEDAAIILARSFLLKNGRAISLINIYICENDNINVTKRDLFEQFWKFECYEQLKNIPDDECHYFGQFNDHLYYKYYDKYNYLFQ